MSRRRPETAEAALAAMCSDMERRTVRSPRTIRFYREEVGTHIGNHTLRRTFGRAMYRSGVEVATISRMLGHESTEQTLKYIGVDLDDMSAAMEIFKL